MKQALHNNPVLLALLAIVKDDFAIPAHHNRRDNLVIFLSVRRVFEEKRSARMDPGPILDFKKERVVVKKPSFDSSLLFEPKEKGPKSKIGAALEVEGLLPRSDLPASPLIPPLSVSTSAAGSPATTFDVKSGALDTPQSAIMTPGSMRISEFMSPCSGRSARSSNRGVDGLKRPGADLRALGANPFKAHNRSSRGSEGTLVLSRSRYRTAVALPSEGGKSVTSKPDDYIGIAEPERTLKRGLDAREGSNFRDREPDRGKKLIIKAASMGHPYAQARCLLHGWGGVRKDVAAAGARLRRLAEARPPCVFSMITLGHLYMEGKGVSKDPKRGLNLLLHLAGQGIPIAQHRAGVAFEHGRGERADAKRAAEFYHAATLKGNSQSMRCLGNLYYFGRGVETDFKRAASLYESAAAAGDVEAQYNLGCCYEAGEGRKLDLKAAVKLYAMAARRGSSSAQFNLGGCYKFGRGLPRDLISAMKWYSKAAQQGDLEAAEEVRECLHKLELEARLSDEDTFTTDD